jgi:PadR family transcriptional regulator PadR
VRKTHALVQLALVLAAEPDAQHYGYDTAKKAGLRSPTLYRLLSSMLEEGWLSDDWEDPAEAAKERRPPRRYYELTDFGKARLGAVLAEAKTDRRFAALSWTPPWLTEFRAGWNRG